MNRALRTAATGMAAQQLNIDTIAHNLANVNTTGFKKSRPEFQDLMYQTLKSTGTSQNPNVQQPVELQVGTGTVPVATLKSFAQGDIQPTQNQLDVAIDGEGFLQVRRPDGTLAYTRDGSLKISGEGSLVTAQGYLVEPAVTFSDDVSAISIARDGTIEAPSTGGGDPVKLGQFELAKFVNAAGLRAIGGNLFVETIASGAPLLGTAGSEGFGELQQGMLESSNVDVVEEMVGMITAQRAYEINAKTIKTVEEMLDVANNIKRG
ncbi:MAG TPA: flagellar basal-body rod protein FlgG [Bacteroidota bacterium]|nr:flagellar basal-body rod protein FlgG [Bacteroidota bacterium]